MTYENLHIPPLLGLGSREFSPLYPSEGGYAIYGDDHAGQESPWSAYNFDYGASAFIQVIKTAYSLLRDLSHEDPHTDCRFDGKTAPD